MRKAVVLGVDRAVVEDQIRHVDIILT